MQTPRAIATAKHTLKMKFRDTVRQKLIKRITQEAVIGVINALNSPEAIPSLGQFFAYNHRWVALLSERNNRTAVDTYDFIETAMPNALFRLDQFEVVAAKLDEVMALDGEVLDLGVYKGHSTRCLAGIIADRTIHGFDSFEGLPGDWSHALAGEFGDIRGLPAMPPNVRLYKGWFDDTLPAWAAQHSQRPISLLRVDCDIYSSTKTIFDAVGSMLRPESWILFDELIGYRGWREHEYRAFMEFLDRSGLGCEYIAYGLTYTLVKLVERQAQD